MALIHVVVVVLLVNFIKSQTIGQNYAIYVQRISQSNNEFALQLYNKLAKQQDENIFYSPYSISVALSMCLLGAQNNTQIQLLQLLNYTYLPSDSINEGNAMMLDYLNQLKRDNLTLSIANKLYSNQEFPIKTIFMNQLEKIFKSEIQATNFSNPYLAASQINNWVSGATNNQIKELINADSINSNTELVLLNAIYFKGNWLFSFDKNETKKDLFYLDDGSTKDVDMMHLTDGFFKLKTNPAGLKAQVCEFPYAGRSVSMSIILPNDGVKLSEIENVLDFERVRGVFETEARTTKLEVYVPKFKLEDSFDLGGVLEDMGAADAFTPDKANFSGISDLDGLYISKVIHKAVVEVSETGTEAAAATGIIIGYRVSMVSPPVFKCNKPFIFIIHENRYNTILFMGKYVK